MNNNICWKCHRPLLENHEDFCYYDPDNRACETCKYQVINKNDYGRPIWSCLKQIDNFDAQPIKLCLMWES
jgi:hypothetical protein